MICNDDFNCLQNVVASVAKYWNRNFELITLETWGFKFVENSDDLDDKLQLCWSGQFEWRNYILENYHGIRFTVKDIRKVDFQNNSESKIFAFYTDAYDCSWLPIYKNIHRQHVCVVEYYKNDLCYFIDDTSKEDKVHVLPIDEVLEIATGAIVFQLISAPQLARHAYIELLWKLLERRKDMSVESQMEKFCAFVTDTPIADLLLNGPYKSKLLMYLKNISSDRKNMQIGFKYIGKICNKPILEIGNDCNILSEKYELLRGYLLKRYFQKKEVEKQYIYDTIKGIILLERNIEIKIMQYAGER